MRIGRSGRSDQYGFTLVWLEFAIARALDFIVSDKFAAP